MKFRSIGYIVLSVLIILAGYGCSGQNTNTTTNTTKKSNIPTFTKIKTSDLQKLIDSGEKISLIDIREADTFNKGHIPIATNIPMSRFTERYKELDSKTKIVLICYSGASSQSAAQMLIEKGYPNVSSVIGGMDAWTGALVK